MCRKAAIHQSSSGSDVHSVSDVGGIGDLFRDFGDLYIETYKPSVQKVKLIRAISVCKTPLLGGSCIVCKDCGKRKYIYHSCGHSHCMLCQSIKREQWVDRLKATLLEVPYIHMTFTLPHELNMLAKLNKDIIYSLIHKVAWQTILSTDQKQKAQYGMTSVLHTFGSDMKYHIHIHALVTFGGLLSNGQWCYPSQKHKIDKYRRICSRYKYLFLQALNRAHENQELQYPQDVKQLFEQTEKKRWVVHSTYPTIDTSLVQNYLAKYINRVAITNNRLQYLKKERQVSIVYNNYVQQESGKAAPKEMKFLEPITAIHQILQHVLPPYFQKTRRYGLHHASSKTRSLVPSALKNNNQTIRTIFEIIHHLLQDKPTVCEQCGSSDFIIQPIETPQKQTLIQIFLDSLPAPPENWYFLYTRYLIPLKENG